MVDVYESGPRLSRLGRFRTYSQKSSHDLHPQRNLLDWADRCRIPPSYEAIVECPMNQTMR